MAGLTEYTRVALGGREGPSDPNYRVGVFRNDPHYGGGSGDSGFASGQDGSNQVRHFTFYLGAGYGIGSTLANRGLYRAEGTNDPRVPDSQLKFRKGEYWIVIEYAGAKATDQWDYAVTVEWKK